VSLGEAVAAVPADCVAAVLAVAAEAAVVGVGLDGTLVVEVLEGVGVGSGREAVWGLV